MTEPRRLEYRFLRYSPDAKSDKNVLIAAILIDPEGGACTMSFAVDWRKKVQLLDPESDLEILGAVLRDIRDRLASPTERAEMMHQLEDSFSNVVRVSERKKCPVPREPKSLETSARALFDEPSTSTVSISSAVLGTTHHA